MASRPAAVPAEPPAAAALRRAFRYDLRPGVPDVSAFPRSREQVPQVRVTGIAAGLHVLCELPPGPDAAPAEQDVVARAAARGLAVAPLAPYRVTGQHDRPALIVGYGTPPVHAFSGAVARLCAVLREAA